VDENEAQVVRRIFELAANGSSLKKIAKTLDLTGSNRFFRSSSRGHSALNTPSFRRHGLRLAKRICDSLTSVTRLLAHA
jgi:hypothetical protein